MSTASVRWLRRLLLVSTVAGCSGDIDGPRGVLVIEAGEAEVVEGGTLVVRTMFEGRTLGANEVEWLSRDPSTLSVRDGIVTGNFPGVAWAVARHGRVTDSVRIVVRFAALAPGEVGMRIGSERAAHRLDGVALFVDYTTPQGARQQSTSIIVSSGGPPVIDDRCCRLLGDTLLQVFFMSLPAPGIRMLQPPVATIETRVTQQLVRTGPDDALVMLREAGGRMRFYVAIKPMLLEFTRVEMPTSQPLGIAEGRIAFEAVGLFEEHDATGKVIYTPVGETTTTIYAEFNAPIKRSSFTPPNLPSSPDLSPSRDHQ